MRKQLIAVMLAVIACLGLIPGADADGNEQKYPPVYVESEFAPLKRAIVSQSEFTDSVLPVSQYYLPLENIEGSGSELRGDWVYLHPDRAVFEQMAWEREELAALLESYGVEVLRPRKLTEDELALATLPEGPTHGRGLSNFFVRDPFIVIGDHVIESNFRKEYRRYEALTARDLFQGSASYVGLPVSDISDMEAGPFLEGGDVLVYHKKIFVGNSGYGSNSAGIQWLKDYIEPYGYEVEEVKLQGHILHLDCVMSLVREGLMIVCEDSFAEGIPETFRDWDRILVPETDAERLAVNGMAINPDVYITDIEFRDTIGKELEARGIKVEYLDFWATRMSAGSVHCSIQPLLRAD
jgi:N-dimethylarginine dimethylaminohydrolase